MSIPVPEHLVGLLESPFFGALATVGRDGSAQVSPMWFEYDGENLRFTHTSKRAKFRNLQTNPSMALAVFHPRDPGHYVEVRGRLIEVIPDPTGAFYVHLGQRYGDPEQPPPPDSADRVVLVMSIEHVATRTPAPGS